MACDLEPRPRGGVRGPAEGWTGTGAVPGPGLPGRLSLSRLELAWTLACSWVSATDVSLPLSGQRPPRSSCSPGLVQLGFLLVLLLSLPPGMFPSLWVTSVKLPTLEDPRQTYFLREASGTTQPGRCCHTAPSVVAHLSLGPLCCPCVQSCVSVSSTRVFSRTLA